MLIRTLDDLARHLGVPYNSSPGILIAGIKNRVYKDTDCGASFHHDPVNTWRRVSLGSIVEGSDAEVGPYHLEFPFSVDEWDETLAVIEEEAEQLWQEDNE